METMKSYLDGMFAKLPNTPDVTRAKNELWQMMEDKYNELISDGVSDNEAVGTVISEFGNLDEIATELGIDNIMEGTSVVRQRIIGLEEAKQYLAATRKHAGQVALGVLLCIISVCGPILSDALSFSGVLGVTVMMVCIGLAIVQFVYASVMMQKWGYMKTETFAMDA